MAQSITEMKFTSMLIDSLSSSPVALCTDLKKKTNNFLAPTQE